MNPLDLSTDISAMSQGDVGTSTNFTQSNMSGGYTMDDARDWD